MRTDVLPAALTLYQEAGHQLGDGYRAGTSDVHVVLIIVAATVVTVLVLLVQLFVTRRTRRLLNVGLVGAAILVVGLTASALAMLDAERQSLTQSEDHGAAPLVLLSTARILALRSLSDENLNLIERGTEQQYLADFDQVTLSIGGSDEQPGLLDRAADMASDPAQARRIELIGLRFEHYLDVHDQVRSFDDAHDRAAAVTAAVIDQADAASALDGAIARELDVVASSLESNVDDARTALRWLPVLTVVAAIVAAAAVLAGLQVRVREYR